MQIDTKAGLGGSDVVFPLGADSSYLDRLRKQVSISDIIRETVDLQKAGREWKGCCPFHNEKTPSFYVNEDKQFYHCFGCGAHGDVIRFVVEQEGLRFPDAVRKLAERAGLPKLQLDLASLDRLADLICGDNGPQYRRSSDLTRFFAAAGAPQFRHDGSTRKAWVLDALKKASPAERRSILLRIASPREYAGDASAVRVVLERLLPTLKLDGLRIAYEGPNPVLEYIEPAFDLGAAMAAPRASTATTAPPRQARVFVSYAHADEVLKNRFLTHLTALKREGLIATWHDRALLPGECLDAEIEEELGSSDLVILLVSADFIASDYCVEKEMQRAFARQRTGDTKVAALILRDCQWHHVPTGGGRSLKDFLALPRDGKPVTQWAEPDEPFSQAVGELRRLLLEPLP